MNKIIISIGILFLCHGNLFAEDYVNIYINAALANSPELKRQQLEVELHKTRKNISVRNFFPDAVVKFNNSSTSVYQAKDYDSKSLSCEAGININTNGNDIENFAINSLKFDSAVIDYDLVKLAVVKDTASNVRKLTYLHKEKELLQKKIANLENRKKILEKEYNLGKRINSDILKIESVIIQSNILLLRKNNEISTLNDIILLKTKMKFSYNIRHHEHQFYKINLLKEDAYIDMAIKNNHNVKKNSLAVKIAEKQYSLSEKDYYPKIRLFGSYGLSGQKMPMSSKDWGGGISVSSNLFGSSAASSLAYKNSDDISENISQQNSLSVLDNVASFADKKYFYNNYLNAVSEENNAIENLKLQVKNAYQKICECSEIIELSKNNSNAAEKQFETDNKRMEAGSVSVAEYLDSFEALSNSKLEIIKAENDYIDASVNLAVLSNNSIVLTAREEMIWQK